MYGRDEGSSSSITGIAVSNMKPFLSSTLVDIDTQDPRMNPKLGGAFVSIGKSPPTGGGGEVEVIWALGTF